MRKAHNKWKSLWTSIDYPILKSLSDRLFQKVFAHIICRPTCINTQWNIFPVFDDCFNGPEVWRQIILLVFHHLNNVCLQWLHGNSPRDRWLSYDKGENLFNHAAQGRKRFYERKYICSSTQASCDVLELKLDTPWRSKSICNMGEKIPRRFFLENYRRERKNNSSKGTARWFENTNESIAERPF